MLVYQRVKRCLLTPENHQFPPKLPSCHLTSYIGQSSMRMTSDCEGHGQGTWPAFHSRRERYWCENLLRMEPQIMSQGVGFLSINHYVCIYIYIYIICKVQPQGQEFSSRAIFNALFFHAICGSRMVLSPSFSGKQLNLPQRLLWFQPAVLSRLSTAELSVHKTVLNKNLGSCGANKPSCEPKPQCVGSSPL